MDSNENIAPTESGKQPLPRVVYSPESPLKNPLGLLLQILGDFWRYRELVWTIFLRDLKAQNRQAILGYLWIIIPPVATAMVWLVLNQQKIVNVDTGDVPYSVFVLIGTTIWTVFSTTIVAPMDSIQNNREVLVKLNVPTEPFILAGICKSAFNGIVLVIVMVMVLLTLGITPKTTWLWFPFAFANILLFSIMIGLLLAPMGTLFQDFKNGLSPLLAVLMYSAPIVIPVPEPSSTYKSILTYNPVTPIVALGRTSLVGGDYSQWSSFLACLIISTTLILLAFVILRVAKPHLIARMGM